MGTFTPEEAQKQTAIAHHMSPKSDAGHTADADCRDERDI